jgi:hypothetical protein
MFMLLAILMLGAAVAAAISLFLCSELLTFLTSVRPAVD